ncbi:hypothetical protein DB30_05796 [Enhygromyxa salina]|uniref:Uncharacterized protein n=1 Tax=Enhygromyxa salina TaxID=215803 RepID=A0A0C2D5F6_9BACT|nr:hypothetical protein DB30_05796 [Enhygromyxa salina]
MLAVTIGALTGCDFFQELENLPEAGEDESGEGDGTAGTGDTGDAGETGGEPCDVLDEFCSDQDTLHSCDLATGELLTYPCATVCGSANLLNFTCTPTATFQHGCWCVNPGDIKLDTCLQLDTCVNECGDPDSTCAGQCFTRTDAQTVRLLGALYSCADRACDEICASSPADCGSCLIAAKAGLWGDCGVAREVCDADQNDEPSWP